MKITQISVFIENRKGRLADVCALLGEKDVNIRALTVADTENYGLLRIVVDKPEVAIEALKQHHFTAKITDVIAVEIEDKPGGLAALLKLLSSNDINVEYMYGFMDKLSDGALMVFRFEDHDLALKFLLDNGIKIASEEDISKL